MNEEDQPIEPEQITEENLAEWAADWLRDLKRLKEEALASATNDDALRMIRQQLKDVECLISRCSKRVGTRFGEDVQANLQELERLFRKTGDSILDALNTEPEQRDPAKWWLNDPDNPPPWEEDNE